MFLLEKDYLSIWEVAHRWAGFDPNATDPDNLPEQVRYLIHKLIEGYLSEDLKLRRSNGKRVPREPLFFLLFDLNIWLHQLWDCLTKDKFDRKKLSNFFVRRSELLKLCEKEEVDPPSFWLKKPLPDIPQQKANINNRPKDEETDRLLSQAVALTMWELDPNIHPAHMAKSKVVQRFGHGRFYKDPDTVKRWISEVDPLAAQRPTGRPPKIEYKIPLEMDSRLDE